jgi:putative flippase GtrA
VKLYNKLIAIRFVRFGVVGFIGFLVNFAGLSLFYHHLKISIVISQLVSAEIALICTFVGNNYWAFKADHHHSFLQKLGRYHMTSWVGLGINSAIVVVLVRYASLYYGLALVIGAAVALVWNYTLNKRFIFITKQEKTDTQTD